MVYKIMSGVEPPYRKRARGCWNKMMDALSRLEVNDKSAVKITFESESELKSALQRIYADNKKHLDWRYTVQSDLKTNSIYVLKVAEQPVIPLKKNGYRLQETG